MLPPSGEQVVLEHGDLRAIVTEVGSTLRSFRVGERPVLWEFGEDEIASGGRGQVLAPWPNRLEDGQYRFDDAEGRAALDEPERHNAIHGLVRWLPFAIERDSGAAARLRCVVHPQPAYPFRLALSLGYELSDDGLVVTCRADNTGERTAPFGLGFHPYVDCGPDGVDGARLELEAEAHVRSSDRGLPVALEPAAGAGFAFADRSLAGVVLDDCLTGLALDGGRRWRATVRTDRGATTVWGDAAFAYLMAYTGDSLPAAERRRAVALEPMTCPPNALRTGEALVSIPPGATWSATWGITPALA